MVDRLNCRNCGAPPVINRRACEYCDTPYGPQTIMLPPPLELPPSYAGLAAFIPGIGPLLVGGLALLMVQRR